jgi:5'-3' exonuclease
MLTKVPPCVIRRTEHGGDAQDGFPGIRGIGKVTAARLLNRHGPIEDFPAEVLDAEQRDRALLFKDLATLRTDPPLFDDVDELRWTGPRDGWEPWAERIGDDRLLARATAAAQAMAT